MLLDFDPVVTAVESQPFWLHSRITALVATFRLLTRTMMPLHPIASGQLLDTRGQSAYSEFGRLVSDVRSSR